MRAIGLRYAYVRSPVGLINNDIDYRIHSAYIFIEGFYTVFSHSAKHYFDYNFDSFDWATKTTTAAIGVVRKFAAPAMDKHETIVLFQLLSIYYFIE